MQEDKANVSDHDIVLSCLNGNKDDFAVLVERYKKLVFSILSKMTCDPNEYADIAQDIFIKVYKNLGRYDPKYCFSTWIIKITVNHVIDMRRKKRIEALPIETEENHTGTQRSAEDEYMAGEKIRLLDRLINSLPEIYRIPIVLYHKHNMSYNNIADSLGIPLSKVKNRIFRARKLLKESFVKEYDKNEMQQI